MSASSWVREYVECRRGNRGRLTIWLYGRGDDGAVLWWGWVGTFGSLVSTFRLRTGVGYRTVSDDLTRLPWYSNTSTYLVHLTSRSPSPQNRSNPTVLQVHSYGKSWTILFQPLDGLSKAVPLAQRHRTAHHRLRHQDGGRAEHMPLRPFPS